MLMADQYTPYVDDHLGHEMHGWCRDLFPINRSLTGEGNRSTLQYLSARLENKLSLMSVSTGEVFFDWTVPKEWKVREAWIADETGNKVVDFVNNNLHLVGYSQPINQWLDLAHLQTHLHSLPDQPDAIPYVTSYYQPTWGFCLTHNNRNSLRSGKYHVYIDSELEDGQLDYAEILIPGQTHKEVLLSSYICHPSLANNELSGPVLLTALSRWLLSQSDNYYTYRIVFVPETIGSIVYIAKNLSRLKKHTYAGYVITCVGDNNGYSFVPSRNGSTPSDHMAQHILKHSGSDYCKYTWLDRGSDERQYCAPGIDLPIASVMRSKYGEYAEYHSSLDNLDYISPQGLKGSFDIYRRIILGFEANIYPVSKFLCEPQLGKRNLYNNLSIKSHFNQDTSATLLNILTYADGGHTLLDIAEILNIPIWELTVHSKLLVNRGLIDAKRSM